MTYLDPDDDDKDLLTPLGYKLFIEYGLVAFALSFITVICLRTKFGASFIKPEIYIEAIDSSLLKGVVVLMGIWGLTAQYLLYGKEKPKNARFYFILAFTLLIFAPWVAPPGVLPDWRIFNMQLEYLSK